MELFVFVRLHARDGQADDVATALDDVAQRTRGEEGCRAIAVFRSTTDPRLFWIHSRWTTEAAFDEHAGMPHTVRFLERVRPLLEQELEVSRTLPLA